MNCIYCGKSESEIDFNREHVIPRFMGIFENNPTINRRICRNCNSIIFSALETKFKEDTAEGINIQMFNLDDSSQIRIRNNNTRSSFSWMNDDFFNQIFPFFEYKDGKFLTKFVPQIKIKRGNDSYIILPIEKLTRLKGTNKFRKLKDFLDGTESKDVSIFVGSDIDDDTVMGEAIGLLNDLGIEYKEKERKFTKTDKDPDKKWEISMDCTIDNNVGRVIAKIAFNYFSFCAITCGQENVLFDESFKEIKNYILGISDVSVRKIIISIKNEPIIYDEKLISDKNNNNIRYVGHTINFYKENGKIVSQVSFLGQLIYTVVLGDIVPELDKENFGSGHLFDPINHEIHGLTQNISKWGSNTEIGFGLFNRI
jgi:hypothetical protein